MPINNRQADRARRLAAELHDAFMTGLAHGDKRRKYASHVVERVRRRTNDPATIARARELAEQVIAADAPEPGMVPMPSGEGRRAAAEAAAEVTRLVAENPAPARTGPAAPGVVTVAARRPSRYVDSAAMREARGEAPPKRRPRPPQDNDYWDEDPAVGLSPREAAIAAMHEPNPKRRAALRARANNAA